MNKLHIGFILFTVLTFSNVVFAQPTQILGTPTPGRNTISHQAFNRTLSADTVYRLINTYEIDSTYSLTIPAGTVILGDTGSAFIVRRGAQVFATGTAIDPIVFTSVQNPGFRAPGDWGGVVLLGRAPLNKVEPAVEGNNIDASLSYGGSVANDNSGILRYVRIEFGGFRYQLNNEINGLTCGGVGSGTEIDHVQVSYSFDDSFEFFGGTVSPTHLVAFGGTDDDFDTDFGFKGKLQFLFGLKDPNYWDPTGESNGFESDNDGSSTSTDIPWTEAIVSNVTLIGPERTNANVPPPIGNSFQYSAVMRRSTRQKLYNSVIMGYPWGLSLRDVNTIAAANSDTLQWRNVSIQATTTPPGGTAGFAHDISRWSGVQTWFDNPAYSNIGSAIRLPNIIGLTDMSDLNNPNPVPATGSELIGSASFANSYLSGFTTVTYRGAFDPSLPMSQQWTAGWTNFDPQNTGYTTDVKEVGGILPLMFVLEQNYPNPFNPLTVINFSVPSSGNAVLKVYDILGREITTLVEGDLTAGNYQAEFNASKLSSGTYFYSLSTNGSTQIKKMMLMK